MYRFKLIDDKRKKILCSNSIDDCLSFYNEGVRLEVRSDYNSTIELLPVNYDDLKILLNLYKGINE